jgi:hypothetical protein
MRHALVLVTVEPETPPEQIEQIERRIDEFIGTIRLGERSVRTRMGLGSVFLHKGRSAGRKSEVR